MRARRVQLNEDPSTYREEVAPLQREIAEDPGEAKPLRDLGVIYMRTQRTPQGYDALRKAFARDQ